MKQCYLQYPIMIFFQELVHSVFPKMHEVERKSSNVLNIPRHNIYHDHLLYWCEWFQVCTLNWIFVVV